MSLHVSLRRSTYEDDSNHADSASGVVVIQRVNLTSLLFFSRSRSNLTDSYCLSSGELIDLRLDRVKEEFQAHLFPPS